MGEGEVDFAVLDGNVAQRVGNMDCDACQGAVRGEGTDVSVEHVGASKRNKVDGFAHEAGAIWNVGYFDLHVESCNETPVLEGDVDCRHGADGVVMLVERVGMHAELVGIPN